MALKAHFLNQEMEISVITNWMRLVPAEYIRSDLKVNKCTSRQTDLGIPQVDNATPLRAHALELASSSVYHCSANGVISHTAPQSDAWVLPPFLSLSLPSICIQLTTCIDDQTFSMSYRSIFHHRQGEIRELGQEIKFETAPRMTLKTHPPSSARVINMALWNVVCLGPAAVSLSQSLQAC